MGGVPRPVLRFVAAALVLAAMAGFWLGVSQTDRRATTGLDTPIAANLPANAVIKDAQPLPPPPPPPPPKPKAANDDDDDDDSDQPAASSHAPAPPLASPVEAPPPPAPGPPSTPGGALPADLPPT
jgi:hypothetical protein